jgi:sortase A
MTHAVKERADSPPPGRPGMSTGDKVRFALRGVGQTLITLGLVVLLFVVYEVWITNLQADRNNKRNIANIKHEIQTQDVVSGKLPLPGDDVKTVAVGKGLGILYIPRLGRDYAEAIVQGSAVPNDSQLEQGAAHYGTTQLPGQKGNFAVAGHRVGKGEPFLNIDKLRTGDAVIVETTNYWYVYRVLGGTAGADPQTDAASTVSYTGGSSQLHGRQIIEPSDGDVLYPVPNQPSVPASAATERLMTMTTCHPKFTASHRMIVYSQLAESVPATGTTMPATIKALYDGVNS